MVRRRLREPLLRGMNPPAPLVEGRPLVPRQRISAEAAVRVWGSPWRQLLRRALAAACRPCHGKGRRNRACCDYCGGDGRARVHVLGHVDSLGVLQIALAERFFEELDMGASALRDSATDAASLRRRALFRRGVPLVPSSVWLRRLEEPSAIEGGGLWRAEATQHPHP